MSETRGTRQKKRVVSTVPRISATSDVSSRSKGAAPASDTTAPSPRKSRHLSVNIEPTEEKQKTEQGGTQIRHRSMSADTKRDVHEEDSCPSCLMAKEPKFDTSQCCFLRIHGINALVSGRFNKIKNKIGVNSLKRTSSITRVTMTSDAGTSISFSTQSKNGLFKKKATEVKVGQAIVSFLNSIHDDTPQTKPDLDLYLTELDQISGIDLSPKTRSLRPYDTLFNDPTIFLHKNGYDVQAENSLYETIMSKTQQTSSCSWRKITCSCPSACCKVSTPDEHDTSSA